MSNIEHNKTIRFQIPKEEYEKNYRSKSPSSVCQMDITTGDNGAEMVSHLIMNAKRDSVIIDATIREFGDDEKQHDIYTPAIAIKYYNPDSPVIFTFIFTLKGKAYLLTNDSVDGYNVMVDVLFGGERNFQSCCKIESRRINSNQGEIIPFINMIEEFGNVW